MRQNNSRQILMMILLAAAVMGSALVAGRAWTQTPTGGNFTLTAHVIGNGGGAARGGAFALHGTLGQPVVGTMRGGGYQLTSGFWRQGGAATATMRVYIPVVRRR